MHRCYTSPAAAAIASTTRSSLDLLARDFAPLALRQHRARAFFLHQRSRAFFSSHAGGRRAHETTTLRFEVPGREVEERRGIDEGGLTFTGMGFGAAAPAPAAADIAVGEALPLEEGDGKWRDEEGWCAAVDVVEPGVTVARKAEKQAGVETGAAVASGSSRAESRLARRQRRELEGKYKPRSAGALEENGGEHEEDAGRDGVLKMIEGMEGPAVQKANAKAKIAKAERRREKNAAKRGDRLATEQRDGEAAKGAGNFPRKKDPKLAKEDNKKKAEPAAPKPKRETWQIQKSANQAKFNNATWQPRKRLSPDTLEGIRALHASDPAMYPTETLSAQFEVSPENIRRILKSKWKPNDEERDERTKRWERRGVRKWTEMAKLGERPPRRWREMGVGSVRGQPDARPAWKRGGRRWTEDVEEDGEGEGFGERIL